MHTTASDGRLSPAELVARASEAGLTILAVTDHDTVAAIAEVTALASSLGIRVVSGIEITAVDDGRDVHMLGYFFDPEHEKRGFKVASNPMLDAHFAPTDKVRTVEMPAARKGWELLMGKVPFSVVPGITAASGCSAYSGIPLTHRDYAQSVRLVTGHLKTGSELDWHNLAAEKQTLVFYMGLNQAATIQAKLLEHGMEADMPVALVENGTAITQRVVNGALTQLGELAQQVESPALIVVGRVVELRDKLNWFSNH